MEDETPTEQIAKQFDMVRSVLAIHNTVKAALSVSRSQGDVDQEFSTNNHS